MNLHMVFEKLHPICILVCVTIVRQGQGPGQCQYSPASPLDVLHQGDGGPGATAHGGGDEHQEAPEARLAPQDGHGAIFEARIYLCSSGDGADGKC